MPSSWSPASSYSPSWSFDLLWNRWILETVGRWLVYIFLWFSKYMETAFCSGHSSQKSMTRSRKHFDLWSLRPGVVIDLLENTLLSWGEVSPCNLKIGDMTSIYVILNSMRSIWSRLLFWALYDDMGGAVGGAVMWCGAWWNVMQCLSSIQHFYDPEWQYSIWLWWSDGRLKIMY